VVERIRLTSGREPGEEKRKSANKDKNKERRKNEKRVTLTSSRDIGTYQWRET